MRLKFGMRRCMLLSGASLFLAASPAGAQTPVDYASLQTDYAGLQTVNDLAALSIEELAQVEVTSVSKRAEPISEAPAAIYVITQEDIRHSPATSLPELLRQAPNLQVQRIDARQFAISARGFNGFETANKLLGLIDGRSIYTTLHSGIFWELHNPLLEDIQQIEVVSGPGGTLYGPNAVNGVVNITTKSAHDTIGGLARATVGGNARTAALRYGAAIGETGAVRVYGNYFDREGFPGDADGEIDDSVTGYQAGFRGDFGSAGSLFTFQGDIFDTNTDIAPGDGERGHNLLARWTRQLGANSSFQLQGYYDDFERNFTLVTDALQTFDVEAQYNATLGAHAIVAGLGARTTKDLFDNDLNPFVLDPERKRLWIGHVFVQDEIDLSDTLALTAGVKLERSSFTGTEILPNVRLAWQPSDRALLWSAVSRAVRTPSRIDRQLTFLPILAPAKDFESEELTAIEAGYRGQPTSSTTLSVSAFYNIYDKLRTTEFRPDGGLPIQLDNGLKGHTWGLEAWATQQVLPWWRLQLGLATLDKDFEEKPGHVDITGGESAGNDPDYKISARSRMALGDAVDLDLGLRAIDSLETGDVESYVEADARVGWRVSDQIELFVAGTNMLHETHAESGDPQGQLVERSVHAGTRLLF